MKALSCAVCVLWVALFTGCTTLYTPEPVRFDVEVTPLDYVQFMYKPGVGVYNFSKNPIRAELSGSGYADARTGQSERVSDSFWQQEKTSAWHDLRVDHLVLSPKETTDLFQALVNAGVYDNVSHDASAGKDNHEFLVIQARIGHKKKTVFTSDPVFMEIFRRLWKEFRL